MNMRVPEAGPKCGEGKMGNPKYVPERRGLNFTEGELEHLTRTCNICGYTRKEICRDKEQEWQRLLKEAKEACK